MKPSNIELKDYSVSLIEDEKQLEEAYFCNNGLVVLTQANQTMVLEAADEVPLFLGIRGYFLTGKAYSLHEAIRERPFIDMKNLIQRLHLDVNAIQVYLGPSLMFYHIEEQDEVLARVKELGYDLACKGTTGKHYLDHQLLVLLQMRKLGIPMANIRASEYDTYDTKELKSALRGDEEKNRFIAVLH